MLDSCTHFALLVGGVFDLLLSAYCISSWLTLRNLCSNTGPSFPRVFSFSVAHFRCVLVFLPDYGRFLSRATWVRVGIVPISFGHYGIGEGC